MTPLCRQYVDRLVQAWEKGSDDAIREIHWELNQDQATYLEVWGALPSTLRRQFKELLKHD